VKYSFDYQNKVWGTFVPSDSPFNLAGLRFHYFLKNISGLSGKILEVGCGAGGNLQALRKYKPYASLYGVDIGESAIEYGKTNFPLINLSVATAEKLPFDDQTFDIVCFFDVLEHVEDPYLCITEACRVLKQGGLIHAYVPCEGEIFTLHGILNKFGINLKKTTAGHIQTLRKEELIRMFRDSSITITDSKWSCHLLNQIGDLAYYSFLHLSGKRLESSLEGTVEKKTNILFKLFIYCLKSVVSLIWYLESRLLWFWIGSGVHITGVKR
jgi:2-polyprenyl-3-methyl-5-hydroxy-6-metoxy-1,4-benzoquinol methylase